MLNLQADKYSILGRSVLLVEISDELEVGYLNLVELAKYLADVDYGVGAGLVTFFQITSNAAAVSERVFPDRDKAQSLLTQNTIERAVLTRTFLPSGHELFSYPEVNCAIVEHINRCDDQSATWLVDGLGSGSLSLRYGFRDPRNPICKVMTSKAHPLDEHFRGYLYADIVQHLNNASDIEVLAMPIRFPGANEDEPIMFLPVSTGEPHLICFSDRWPSVPYRNEILYDIFERPVPAQRNFLRQIVIMANGAGARNPIPDVWPGTSTPLSVFNLDHGINLVFARIPERNAIDVRYYSRGTLDEVRLQGSGAVAVAQAAHTLGKVTRPSVEVRSLLNTNDGNHKAATISYASSSWWLEAPVNVIWQGHVAAPKRLFAI